MLGCSARTAKPNDPMKTRTFLTYTLVAVGLLCGTAFQALAQTDARLENGGKEYEFTEIGSKTLSKVLGFPYKFFQKLPCENCQNDLDFCKNIGSGDLKVMVKGEKVVRVRKANKYVYPMEKVIEFLIDLNDKHNGEIHNLDYDRERAMLTCRVLNPLGVEVFNDDSYKFGYNLWMGEGSRMKLEECLWRVVCSNGMMVHDDMYDLNYTINCKQRLDSEIYGDLIQMLNLDRNKLLGNLSDRFKMMKEVEMNLNIVRRYCLLFEGMGFLNSDLSGLIMGRFEVEEPNLYGFIQAITYVAKGLEGGFKRKLEKFAGTLTQRNELLSVQ